MASTTTTGYAVSSTSHRGWTRPLSVAGAVIAALAVWVLAVPILGVHLTIRFGSGSPQTIAIGYVIGATLLASLAGWGVLAALERRTTRAMTIWTILAVGVLVISLSLPLTAGISASTKAVLVAMHVIVAGILIAGLRAGARRRA